VQGLSKVYQIYAAPRDRLKQFLLPRLQRLLRRPERRYYRDFAALHEISFEVRRGETVGVIGRNGSGKSTLLQIICGTLHPSAGTVDVQGRVAALLELGSGFNPEFTGRENVFLNASVLGLSREQTQARLARIEAFADIGAFIDRPVKTYSSGMAVRLAFAVIAHVDADILVIDEALSVGDAFFTQKCMRYLREFMKQGTVLFVSHDTAAVRGLCDRVVWLDRGTLRAQGEPKEICERYLSALYEGQSRPALAAAAQPGRMREASGPRKDQRQDLILSSNLRNDLRVFEFDPETASFGRGGATIREVALLDPDGVPLNWVVGGLTVTLRIRADVHEALDAPVIGFYVKDRLGQTLFGDNTYLSHREHPVACQAGMALQAEFTFQMPVLPKGSYSISAAIANGTQESHVQHHWLHDALVLQSETSSIATGLIGLPMLEIRLERAAAAAA
jgi:lipopolysaccharide transport system ATP-binding protein